MLKLVTLTHLKLTSYYNLTGIIGPTKGRVMLATTVMLATYSDAGDDGDAGDDMSRQ